MKALFLGNSQIGQVLPSDRSSQCPREVCDAPSKFAVAPGFCSLRNLRIHFSSKIEFQLIPA